MDLIFKEDIGLLPFELDSKIIDIEKIIGKHYKVKKNIFHSNCKRLIFEEHGLFFDIDENETVEAIETIGKNKVVFYDNELFSMNKSDIEKMLSKHDKNLDSEDGFTSKVLGISLYYEDKKNKASSILAFRKGYYDKKQDLNPIDTSGKVTTVDDLFDLLK